MKTIKQIKLEMKSDLNLIEKTINHLYTGSLEFTIDNMNLILDRIIDLRKNINKIK